MKKITMIIAAILLFVSCSKDDDSFETKTNLSKFTEPYFEYNSEKSKITALFGEFFKTESNQFMLGYKMVYEASENGVYNYYFSLDNTSLLNKTEVSFYPGKKNVDFLKSFLNSKYTFKTETTRLGLTVISYTGNNTTIELMYLDGTYNGILLTYGKKYY